MSPACFPAYISWMCTLTEETKALCYSSIHQPCCSSLYQAISNVTLFFRVGIKTGTFPGFWVFVSLRQTPQWWHQPTAKTLLLPCRHCFYRHWPFLMQFVGVEGFFEVEHGQASQGFPRRWQAGSIYSTVSWQDQGEAVLEWNGLCPGLGSRPPVPLCEGNGRGSQPGLLASLRVRSQLGQLNEPCVMSLPGVGPCLCQGPWAVCRTAACTGQARACSRKLEGQSF